MKVMKRIFLVFWGLFGTGLGVFAFLCSVDSSIRTYWVDMLNTLLSSFIGIGVGAGLLILGILAVIFGAYARKPMPFAKVAVGEFGSVDVSLSAIDNVVKKVAAGIDGVKDIKTRIKVENNVVDVLIDVVMLANCHVPDTIALLQQDVKAQLESSVGIKIGEVKTAITNIISK